ncbi:MAG: alpha/beta hydrolase [Chloroflexi bacterium]|nr:alpha/beta hydrolase [Chloroflexota bacterium]
MSDADLFAWARGFEDYELSPVFQPNTHRVRYRLRALADRTFVKRRAAASFLAGVGLSDFTWSMVWHDEGETSPELLPEVLAQAEGFVIFLHGWDGSHLIWEDMPEAVVNRHPRLVAFVLDHNGFGGSSFVDETPDVQICNPPAAMRVAEGWLSLMRLRGPMDAPAKRVINFVGHSMGGATLFYLDPAAWRLHEYTRCALAPALLLEDELHRAFYQALGLGIGLLNRLPDLALLDRLDEVLTPAFVKILAGGASSFVQSVHETVYMTTPKGVIARTFAAMGVLDQVPSGCDWRHFRVALGEADRLVGLEPQLSLLQRLAVPGEKIRVRGGDHYFFSVGDDTQPVHAPNRQIVIEDILDLHDTAVHSLNS